MTAVGCQQAVCAVVDMVPMASARTGERNCPVDEAPPVVGNEDNSG